MTTDKPNSLYPVIPYFDTLSDFQALLKAHKAARKGKQDTAEEIQFDADLSENLWSLVNALKDGTYNLLPYYTFTINDPKTRVIHALHYRDRVVQHALCDNVLRPVLEPRLIYDNSACRIGKGTHFSMNRLTKFFTKFYREFGTNGYILRCDIRKFFDNIDHEILKAKLRPLFSDDRIYNLLTLIIDSYHTTPGRGLPLGNQTSQWFAIYFLDVFDRLIKERFQIKFYTRYMDDAVMIHSSREYLEYVRDELSEYLKSIGLEFNAKTQVFPIKNGVDYLGFHFKLTETGKVVRRVKTPTKRKLKKALKRLQWEYDIGDRTEKEIREILNSYNAHLRHGHTKGLRVLIRNRYIVLEKAVAA